MSNFKDSFDALVLFHGIVATWQSVHIDPVGDLISRRVGETVVRGWVLGFWG